MNWSHLIAGVSVFLTGLMPLSCHKTATTAAKQPATPAAAVAVVSNNVPQHTLGEVSLTNHLETCLQLGGGKNCTLTPHLIDAHTVQLTLALESKTAAGKVHDVCVTQVTAKSGKPLDVAVGDFQLSFTPNIAAE
jgi:hypothetical protein